MWENLNARESSGEWIEGIAPEADGIDKGLVAIWLLDVQVCVASRHSPGQREANRGMGRGAQSVTRCD